MNWLDRVTPLTNLAGSKPCSTLQGSFLPHTHVHDDLLDPGHLHDVPVLELLLERRRDRLLVVFSQASHGVSTSLPMLGYGTHDFSVPREPFDTSFTLLMAIGASASTIPPCD